MAELGSARPPRQRTSLACEPEGSNFSNSTLPPTVPQKKGSDRVPEGGGVQDDQLPAGAGRQGQEGGDGDHGLMTLYGYIL